MQTLRLQLTRVCLPWSPRILGCCYSTRKGPPCIGIDLGNTNSCVAYLDDDGEPRVITFTDSPSVPTVMSFLNSGQRLFGSTAKKSATVNSPHCLQSTKRLIGRQFDAPDTPKEMHMLTNRLVPTQSGHIAVEVMETTYSMTHVTAMFLNHLKMLCELHFDAPIETAVVSVPARFDPDQRQATFDAVNIAGFPVFDIIEEPVAAALAYGLHHAVPDGRPRQLALVCDLGGSTFDLSVLAISGKQFDIKSTVGDCLLGGDDWDKLLFDHWSKEFYEQHGIDIRTNGMASRELRGHCEQAKVTLSTQEVAVVKLPFFIRTRGSRSQAVSRDGRQTQPHLPGHFAISRPAFEELCKPLFDRVTALLHQAIEQAGVSPSDIDSVVLVGAMTAMPRIRSLLQEIFPQSSIVDSASVPPDQAVAMGAACRAGMLQGRLPTVEVTQPSPQVGLLDRITSVFSRKPAAFKLPPETIQSLKAEIEKYNADEDARVERDDAIREATAVLKRCVDFRAELEDSNQTISKPLLAHIQSLEWWKERVGLQQDHVGELTRATEEALEFLTAESKRLNKNL
eukprot:NODE_1194_length_1840_cov_44.301689_g1132_i0.p1 GENE.NODE_1194_length_1840_cov_44.301689_g1132_i0~~NODE_1194_length_1840_cov_44.301689_g1132_i0.p1  ORF type:complete len:566 (+),score=37.93 NODE_1194_length_1840_cov_44.301689_g1132_i0:66-1763(+)